MNFAINFLSTIHRSLFDKHFFKDEVVSIKKALLFFLNLLLISSLCTSFFYINRLRGEEYGLPVILPSVFEGVSFVNGKLSIDGGETFVPNVVYVQTLLSLIADNPKTPVTSDSLLVFTTRHDFKLLPISSVFILMGEDSLFINYGSPTPIAIPYKLLLGSTYTFDFSSKSVKEYFQTHRVRVFIDAFFFQLIKNISNYIYTVVFLLMFAYFTRGVKGMGFKQNLTYSLYVVSAPVIETILASAAGGDSNWGWYLAFLVSVRAIFVGTKFISENNGIKK